MEGIIVMVVTIVALAVFADLIKEGDARLTALLRRIPTFLEQKAADKATDGLVQENRVIEQQPKMTKWESGAKFAPVPPFPFRIEQQPNMTQEEKTR